MSPQARDLELFQALKQGQLDALDKLYDRYAHPMYGVALRILSNPEEVEEIIQDVFLNLWNRDIYNPNRGCKMRCELSQTGDRAHVSHQS